MATDAASKRMVTVSQAKLLALVRGFGGGSAGLEDPDNPLPPGPWDPVIRRALEGISMHSHLPQAGGVQGQSQQVRSGVFGGSGEFWKVALASLLARHPEIYDAIGGGHHHSILDEVALNPQPLPPRWRFMKVVATTVIERAGLLYELAGAMPKAGEQQGIIIVSGHTSRFMDEFCGTGYRLRWPFPGPRPNWFEERLTGIDLITIASEFDQAARELAGTKLGNHLGDVSQRLVEMGFARL